MEREIKFRGKRVDNVDNGKWVYGYYHKECSGAVFIAEEANLDVYKRQMVRAVDAETVGQFIGLTDRNGKEIYEGDKVKCRLCRFDMVGYVVFQNSCFQLKYETMYLCLIGLGAVEIVGNIHDNPELI